MLITTFKVAQDWNMKYNLSKTIVMDAGGVFHLTSHLKWLQYIFFNMDNSTFLFLKIIFIYWCFPAEHYTSTLAENESNLWSHEGVLLARRTEQSWKKRSGWPARQKGDLPLNMSLKISYITNYVFEFRRSIFGGLSINGFLWNCGRLCVICKRKPNV